MCVGMDSDRKWHLRKKGREIRRTVCGECEIDGTFSRLLVREIAHFLFRVKDLELHFVALFYFKLFLFLCSLFGRGEGGRL
jgi:hypothetical protein